MNQQYGDPTYKTDPIAFNSGVYDFDVKNNVQNMARDLGLDQQKINVVNGKITYNNVEIGNVGVTTAQEIAATLNSYANPNQGPMSIYNP